MMNKSFRVIKNTEDQQKLWDTITMRREYISLYCAVHLLATDMVADAAFHRYYRIWRKDGKE